MSGYSQEVITLLQQHGAVRGQQEQAQQQRFLEVFRTYNQHLDHEELTDNQEGCSICRDDLSNALLALPCRHFFDQACIEPWLVQHQTCPLCRRAVTVEQLRAAIVAAVFMEQVWDESYGFDYQTSDCNIL